MRIRVLCLLLTLLLPGLVVIYPAEAQAPNPNFDVNKGFQWLAAHCPQGNCRDDIPTTAFYAMAMRDSGALDYADSAVDYIKSKEDTAQHCWPLGGCKIKDTAFAIWVLSEYGHDTDSIEAYLKTAVSADPNLKDFWYLEVITTNNGTCKISYNKGTENVQKDVPVAQGHFPSCSQSSVSTFFDLNACLEPSLLNKHPGIELDVNCNDLGPSTIVSVIFNKGSAYYIMKKSSSPRDIFTIDNGCFGTTSKSSCNLETSLFTNWMLSSTGSDLSTRLYLRNSYDAFKALDNALLSLSTTGQLKQQYIRDLVALQRNDGSFNKQVFETAMAVIALKGSSESASLNSAMAWLQSKQGSDGSWENSELKTAAVLYAAFSGAAVSLPPPGRGGGLPEPVYECGDGFCDPETENANTCPDDCGSQTSCQVNGICETFFEDSVTCPQDCTCGDGICDNVEITRGSCSADCRSTSSPVCGNSIVEGSEECDIDPATGFGDDFLCPGRCQSACVCGQEKKSSFPWWITIVIAVLVVGLIVFYVKFRGRFANGTIQPGKKPPFSSRPPFQPEPRMPPSSFSPPQSQAKKSKVEEELDKSIEEARKLLKKI